MRRMHALALAVASLLALPAATSASTSQPFDPPPPNVDLRRAPVQTIVGEDSRRELGTFLATGDVNGDGIEDTVTSDTYGTVYVVFGDQPGLIDTALFGAVAGYTIRGASPVSDVLEVVGDVNGDGLEDIAVQDTGDDVLIVPGKTSATQVDMFAPVDGFEIEVGTTFAEVTVDRAGDVNRDGLGDVLVSDGAARDGRGRAYVVFGKADRDPVRLDALGDDGYRITGARIDAIAYAGDVNGDGRGDALVSNPDYDTDLRNVGRVSVVFGKGSTSDVDLGQLGSQGYEIVGGAEGDAIGSRLLNAGDVDGDGTPDQLVAGFGVWVVFGKRSSTTTVALTPNFRGFEIEEAAGFASQQTLGAGGDTNGDGLADLLIGYPYTPTDWDYGVGAVWVVYGKASRTTVSLETNTNGYRIDGVASGDETGRQPTFRRAANRTNVLVDARMHTYDPDRLATGAVFEIDDADSSFARADPPFAGLELLVDPVRVLLGGSSTPTIAFRALEPFRARATLWRLQPGTQSPTGRCVAGRTPKQGQRGCVVRQKVRTATFTVRTPREVSTPLTASFRPGAYVVTFSARTADGRTFGPYRKAFRVQP